MKTKMTAAALAGALSIVLAAPIAAQPPAGGRGPQGGRGAIAAPPARPAAYPDRPPADPAVLERGKAVYGVQCNFCHGSDARGGEGGPNLLRSELVLNDQKGELIGTVVQNGKGEMPKFNLTAAQISDVAAYIHSFKVGGYDISRMTPATRMLGGVISEMS
jgi:mono/diheme cytochrome c family protein